MDSAFKAILPSDLVNILLRGDVKKEELLYGARFDMDKNSRYMDGYVILTRNELIVAILPYQENIVRFFGGNQDNRIKEKENDAREWSINTYPIAAIKSLEVSMLVSGGLLYAMVIKEKTTALELYSQEQAISLAAFTNSCMNDMKRLVKLFVKVKEEKKLTKEDFEDKKQEVCCPKCGTRYPYKDRRICPKCMDRRSIFFRTLSYFKPHKLKLIIMMLCFLATATLNLVWPYLNGTILYDRVLARDEKYLELLGLPAGRFVTLLGAVVLTMLLTSLITQLLVMLQGVLTAKIVPEVVKDIKSGVFRSMGRLSVSFYSRRQTGGLMTRVLDDADRVTDFYINGLPYFFIHVFTILFISIVMFTMNWLLALASLALLPLLTYVSIRMLPRLWNHYGRRHRAARSMNAQINDNITGARVVKAFGQEDSEQQRFGTYNNRVKQAELHLVAYDNHYKALYHIVQNVSSYIVLGLGSALVLSKTSLELGVLVTFIGYVGLLKQPLDFMAEVFRWWTESMNCSQRIFEIVDAVPEIQESYTPKRLEEMKGEITLKNVTFGYEAHKPVLRDISFQVEAGKMLGIVGRSGAGKSTLVNLISRLYDVEEGEILVDGIDIRELSFKDLHDNIAMVSQETYIFMGTIAQNIAYARPSANKQEILRAAVLASAHDFICKMPDGYDTMIGSSGRELSGGERQRISIARAILADSKILILDEATASVDTETEQAIQKSLAYLVKGRTTLSIAHRLSTLKDADSLVVIDEGRLTEAGTHRELINLQGTYYKLMQLQTKALALRGIE
ncbi:MAG TPA: ABC transporter ATP-binding protein [Mobilitalea sp.]|nr:ABC transporter ATP-binding protein [Mobilitalea sp.]